MWVSNPFGPPPANPNPNPNPSKLAAAITFSTCERGTILRDHFDKAHKEANEGGAFPSLTLVEGGIQVTVIPLPPKNLRKKTEKIQGCVDCRSHLPNGKKQADHNYN